MTVFPKKTWVEDEDALLLTLISKHGPRRWKELAEDMPNRTGKQCRERWLNHLHPNNQAGPWTSEEDAAILRGVKIYGTRWAQVCKLVSGRSDNAVKNRWNSTLKGSGHESEKLKDEISADTSIGNSKSGSFEAFVHPKPTVMRHFDSYRSGDQRNGLVDLSIAASYDYGSANQFFPSENVTPSWKQVTNTMARNNRPFSAVPEVCEASKTSSDKMKVSFLVD
eukprot:CAMPEP_0182446624 /NCGR_PEP_ID=MMETSP1172-20130603/4312_1 /TAXON_ID=708627 /ORGANISM="Timspurckia oligopyrenoides, Strain CCMP3278" /LENGTH=222 /DNA_ID=CAMNT_0024642577 /DNA_START=223 /DNA_END=891 /DNA_ORIENTATION=+